MFLLIKVRHNVADYHRIIKFVIGGWRLCWRNAVKDIDLNNI